MLMGGRTGEAMHQTMCLLRHVQAGSWFAMHSSLVTTKEDVDLALQTIIWGKVVASMPATTIQQGEEVRIAIL